MTEHELRVCYETIYRMIANERKMRESVLRSSPYLQQKLHECDTAIIALTTMKDELKRHVVGPIQETLIDVPEGKRGGVLMTSASATKAVSKAIKSGSITRRPDCELCGSHEEDWGASRLRDIAKHNKCLTDRGIITPSPSGRISRWIVAHHWRGYEYPLDIWWICRSCNRKLQHKHDGSLSIEEARRYVKNT